MYKVVGVFVKNIHRRVPQAESYLSLGGLEILPGEVTFKLPEK